MNEAMDFVDVPPINPMKPFNTICEMRGAMLLQCGEAEQADEVRHPLITSTSDVNSQRSVA